MLTIGRRLGFSALVWMGFSCAPAVTAQDGASKSQEAGAAPPPVQLPAAALALPSVGRGGRIPIPVDAIQARIAAGKWQPPHAGEKVAKPDGKEVEWKELSAGEDGAFADEVLNGGYLYLAVDAPEERVLLLEASGHSMVYINGEPRAGDVYQNGIVRLPVLLKKGVNEFLFNVARGRIAPKLSVPSKEVFIDLRDATLPDLSAGDTSELVGALLVVNCTTAPARIRIDVEGEGVEGRPRQDWTSVPACSLRKVAFSFALKHELASNKLQVDATLWRPARAAETTRMVELDRQHVELDVRSPAQLHRYTFLSDIDGSVQYFAVLPAARQPSASEQPAASPGVILSLHGASVEGSGQAGSYAPQFDMAVVAPTNRRPFGFDWEDWGRLDALEVLRHARDRLKFDPRRVYLSGHSMGGHGTWQLGVTYPDQFAAIGPSAGWLSFWTYGMGQRGEPKNALDEMLQRSTNASDTPQLMRNLQRLGVYILHGDQDDNVPVEQARKAREILAEFHHDFELYEQAGAGHWWDAGHDAGADCVDWQPMMDFFARHRLAAAAEVSQVDFTTMNPGVSAGCYWATIYRQGQPLKPSTVHLRRDPVDKRFVGTTENVAILALELIGQGIPEAGKAVTFELDEQTGAQKLEWTPNGATRAWLRRDAAGHWIVNDKAPDPAEKSPQRNGMFKDAFRNQVIFAYGTQGNAAENACQFAKARYDAETFWYRGNAAVDLMTDLELQKSGQRVAGRNVVVYGNADTFAGWEQLVGAGPVIVKRGLVRLGEREFKGDDLGLLLIRPRADADGRLSIGVVAGSGITGMHAVERLPYFMSGVAYPDVLLVGADALMGGQAGVRAAGFFGPGWTMDGGDFVFGSDGP